MFDAVQTPFNLADRLLFGLLTMLRKPSQESTGVEKCKIYNALSFHYGYVTSHLPFSGSIIC